MQKLTILSSVPEWIFGSIANNPAFGFTQAESQSALKDEKQVLHLLKIMAEYNYSLLVMSVSENTYSTGN